jgi:hypothetical protein
MNERRFVRCPGCSDVATISSSHTDGRQRRKKV